MPLIRIMTWTIFILLTVLGLWLAAGRHLWNDEFYSLFQSVIRISYGDIFSGRILEGNNSPLFYTLQKFQCDLCYYTPPFAWIDEHLDGTHVFDQFLLRIQGVVLMSASLSALFCYFCRRNSLAVGLYALAVTMTSSLFWVHWTEARPYALWFALSLFQVLLLLDILEDPAGQNKNSCFFLILVHWLLALTSTISIVQIVAAGAVMAVFHKSKLLWYLPLVLGPLGVCGFYYMHAPHYHFFFVDGPQALINANIPKDRLFIIFISAGILIFQCRRIKWMDRLEIKFLSFFLLMLGIFGLMLLKLKSEHLVPQHGFQISSRYFLPLVPAGSVGAVLFSVYLVRVFPSRLWRAMAIMFLAAFLAFRFHKTEQQVFINLNLSAGLRHCISYFGKV